MPHRLKLRFIATAVVAMMAVNGLARASEVKMNDPVRLPSAYPFQETVQKLRAALEEKGFTIFAEIDQQRAARTVGLEMPPTVLLIYGNPKGGTSLMVAAPDFALELPLKILVRQEGEDKVLAVYTPASMLDGKYGLPPGLAGKLAGAEPVIAAALRAQPN